MTDWGSLDYSNTPKSPRAGNDYLVHTTNPHVSFVWNGSAWVQETRPNPLSSEIEILSTNVFAEKKDGKLVIHRKFQNSTTTPVYSYIVSQKTSDDPITGARHMYSYEYALSGSMYDTRNGTAKFNKVTVNIPNYGREISYFFNDYEDPPGIQTPAGLQKNSNVDFDKLDGFPYKKESFNIHGKKVSEQTFAYAVYRGSDRGWPTGVFHSRATGVSTTVDGVTIARIIATNDGNGLPAQITETNSDGKQRITRTQYAFEVSDYAEDM